ncbi:putative Ig domain-containing protein [Geothrix sp. 21YS21S-2]|uniref:putative Ig domain-containing protein n=1 Tax=Geothrix sp. 21YS21S-2 TaxID=3068893 RepID=UPI0027BB07D2|nr:putative Ig domain-containing protein [Geothrix sp. 21YS21S-2]
MRPFRWIGLFLAGSLLVNLGCGGGGSSTPAPQGPANLTYAANPAVFTIGEAITPDLPSSTGGTPARYSVTPTLPAGLSLSSSTGAVSGTPTAITARATYTVTATNSAGGTTAGLTITVNDAAPTGVSYGIPTAVYARGAAIAANTPSHTGGTPTGYLIEPALPAGLSLSSASGVITGTPTAVTAAAAYVVTASNATGSVTTTLTLSVVEVAPANLTYTRTTAAYPRGIAITANSPSFSGGAPTGYVVSPALPAGLAMDPATGVISGMPTTLTAPASYVVTGSNPAGSAQATLTLSVVEVAPSGLTYTVTRAYYAVGTAIAANVPSTSGGGAVASYAVSPSLPPGLALNTATGVISGTPTAATAMATYTVTASNGGGSATAALSIVVFPPGSTLDLAVAKIEFTQSTQTPDNSVPIIAGKNGLARVYVLANQANTAAPVVQVTLTNNGTAVSGYPKTVAAPGAGTPLTVAEGTLASSWNLAIPGTDLASPVGTGYAIEAVIDPGGLVAEGDRTNNTTTVALAVTTVPTFRTTIFPVVLSSGTANVTEATKASWVARLARMWPIADLDILVGAPFTGSVSTLSATDDTTWSKLLSDLSAKHAADGATGRYYYGAVTTPYASGTAGMGYVPTLNSPYSARTAIGWDKSANYADGGLYPEVFAHEVGHNFGLSHAPCGVSSYDTGYPYASGVIGVWGYDSTRNILESPTSVVDVMSYCSPVWVSDYNYKKVITTRAATGAYVATAADTARECLIARGIVHKDGSVELLPGFRTRAVPSPVQPEGDLRLEGLDAGGNVVLTSPMEAEEMGCDPGPHDRHFLVALPAASADLDALASLRVLKDGQILASRTSPRVVAGQPSLRRVSAGEVALDWDAAAHPAVMVRDTATGEVVAILEGGQRTFQTSAASLDLVFSDGVKGHTTRMRQVD